jgi:ribonuclease VapC
MTVYDSSALLTFLQSEPGAHTVREHLTKGGYCSAAIWSEVAQKTISAGRNWPKTRMLLLAFGLSVESVTMADAEFAARLWSTDSSLSLADRVCLALGARLDTTVLTCDRQWADRPGVVQIR